MATDSQRPRLNKRPNGVAQSTRHHRMTKAIAKGHPDGAVKVQLDAKTVVTMRPSSLSFWLARYPNLRIIQRPDHGTQ
jgi:hypothetical protein